MNAVIWLWILVAGHCLADTTLQPGTMSGGKNRHREIDLSRVPKGQKPLNLWLMWLTHHAMIHGLIVYLLTQNVYLGMIESVSHWVIDFGKCENWYGPYIDQSLHIIMKIGYVIFLVGVAK